MGCKISQLHTQFIVVGTEDNRSGHSTWRMIDHRHHSEEVYQGEIGHTREDSTMEFVGREQCNRRKGMLFTQSSTSGGLTT